MIPELEEIKRIFLNEWDPIGVAGIPEAADEYDSYAFQVFTSLHSGATAESINEYLRLLETEHMGLSAISGRSEEVARKVFAIHQGRKEL
jgi:hypothetical protein